MARSSKRFSVVLMVLAVGGAASAAERRTGPSATRPTVGFQVGRLQPMLRPRLKLEAAGDPRNNLQFKITDEGPGSVSAARGTVTFKVDVRVGDCSKRDISSLRSSPVYASASTALPSSPTYKVLVPSGGFLGQGIDADYMVTSLIVSGFNPSNLMNRMTSIPYSYWAASLTTTPDVGTAEIVNDGCNSAATATRSVLHPAH